MSNTTTTTVYRIETKDEAGNWDSYGVGYDGNWFESEEDAEAAWVNLYETSPDYLDVDHRVVAIELPPFVTDRSGGNVEAGK